MSESRILDGVLVVDGVALLEGADAAVTVEPATRGAFLLAKSAKRMARFRVALGKARESLRFVACHRYEPFWMKPRPGRDLAEVPSDTQSLWLELSSGKVALIVPLIGTPFRASLVGRDGGLAAVLDTGDPHTRGTDALVAYVAVGDDPYELAREGAAIVAARLGEGKLRRDKALPAFANDFGWCTWDAFYQEVSHDKVEIGLESFRAGGVEPRFLILDDGWQSVREAVTGERRLTAFAANEKFPNGLSATVELAKKRYGVRSFLVWHAMQGYWGGIDPAGLPNYGVETALRWQSPEILTHAPNMNCEWWGACVGRPSPEALTRFFDDYHAYLAKQGVDGVKVDNQASVEGVSHGIGGRVDYMRRHRRALEASTRRHFGGALINCMSNANEMIYQTLDSTLMRSSTDFWPNDPSSHGLHVYTNALVGLWFGEFIHPDWDMFQSAHPAGAYHAAARAVSGSPVYVSDKPTAHDFELLKKLVLSDGSVLRAREIGLPTRDSIFGDPLNDEVLFKVFNFNVAGAVVGVFNARHRERDNLISGSVSAADVPGLGGEEFAVYLGRANRLQKVGRGERIPVALDSLEAEIATIVPIEAGIAPIGLVDKLNGGGAITSKGPQGATYRVELRDGGKFVSYCDRRPTSVTIDGARSEFEYAEGRLDLEIRKAGSCVVELGFE